MLSAPVHQLILDLYDANAICLNGPYTLKSGLTSPIYVDLRVIVSYPKLLNDVASAMWTLIAPLKSSLLCGVPYTALPIATIISAQHNVPMVMRRKEVKEYGLKKAIEGHWKTDGSETCVIIEDLVTSGLSCFETVAPLEANSIRVHDIVVLLDREQGAKANIHARGLDLHSVFTLTQVMEALVSAKRITDEVAQSVFKFIRENQVAVSTENNAVSVSALPAANSSSTSSPAAKVIPAFSFEKRLEQAQNAFNRQLLNIIIKKKSNLCLSADVTTSAELLHLARTCGPYICLLKTHVDILSDFTPTLIQELAAIAKEHEFLLFEDRKFADIGNTVSYQYTAGIHHIASWSHLTNAHLLPGTGLVTGLYEGAEPFIKDGKVRALLLIAEMSSKGCLIDKEYTAESKKVAEEQESFIAGFICQNQLSSKPGLLHFTPGVALPPIGTTEAVTGDNKGQQYNTPSIAINKGADVIIVGRGIYAQKGNEVAECKRYQEAGWEAYQSRVSAASN